MKQSIKNLISAYEKDPTILTDRGKVNETLGSDPRWLLELGLSKNDLIRLERLGLAYKAHYETETNRKKKRMVGQYTVSGPIRARWILFKPEV